MSRLIKADRDSTRDLVIAHYRRKLDRAYGRTAAVRHLAGKPVTEAAFWTAMLDDLEAGRTIQLHHNDLPTAIRPRPLDWLLYELRGDELVGVPTWKPGQPRPAEWTV